MKNRWKSYIYVPVLACALAMGGVLVWNYYEPVSPDAPEQVYYLDEYFGARENAATEAQPVDEKDVVLEGMQGTYTAMEAEFILCMEEDYVMVYRTSDMSESYMATGIGKEDLPPETLAEIQKGKKIPNEEALYFFLESYSS